MLSLIDKLSDGNFLLFYQTRWRSVYNIRNQNVSQNQLSVSIEYEYDTEFSGVNFHRGVFCFCLTLNSYRWNCSKIFTSPHTQHSTIWRNLEINLLCPSQPHNEPVLINHEIQLHCLLMDIILALLVVTLNLRSTQTTKMCWNYIVQGFRYTNCYWNENIPFLWRSWVSLIWSPLLYVDKIV